MSTPPTVNDAMDCLTVAASGAITDYSDLLVRRHLKEHPDAVAYRLDLLEGMIGELREQVAVERAKGAWAGTEPFSPDAEHHEMAADFAAHTCNCEWCIHAAADGPGDPA